MERFINCDCIKNKKGELIPLWNINWEIEDFDDGREIDEVAYYDIKPDSDSSVKYGISENITDHDIIHASYDLIKKKVVSCKRIIKLYKEDRNDFKEGDEIFVKHKFSTNKLYRTKIKSITQGGQDGIYYTTDDRLNNWVGLEVIEDITIDNIPKGNEVIQIITYRKHYILEDGTETDYDYEFFKLEEK